MRVDPIPSRSLIERPEPTNAGVAEQYIKPESPESRRRPTSAWTFAASGTDREHIRAEFRPPQPVLSIIGLVPAIKLYATSRLIPVKPPLTGARLPFQAVHCRSPTIAYAAEMVRQDRAV